jgi:hypothetical protein
LINWGFVSATILIGLTMVLISSVRRPEPHEGKG